MERNFIEDLSRPMGEILHIYPSGGGALLMPNMHSLRRPHPPLSIRDSAAVHVLDPIPCGVVKGADP
jgi:hypothetical protein